MIKGLYIIHTTRFPFATIMSFFFIFRAQKSHKKRFRTRSRKRGFSAFLSSQKHEGRFGRKRNAVGTRAAGECFHSFFEFSQTFTSVSITRQKHEENIFYFFLENSPRKITENEENLIFLFIIKTQILYTTQFTRHNLTNQVRNRKHLPCFYRVLV